MSTDSDKEQRRCANGDGKPARAKGLCTACYAAARRNTPGNRKLGPRGGVILPVVRLDPKLDLLMRAAVDLEGVTLAEWVRRAIHHAVLAQAGRHPQLAHLGASLAEDA